MKIKNILVAVLVIFISSEAFAFTPGRLPANVRPHASGYLPEPKSDLQVTFEKIQIPAIVIATVCLVGIWIVCRVESHKRKESQTPHLTGIEPSHA